MIPGREEQFPYSSEEIGVVPYNLALAQSRGYESRIAELAEVITEFTSGYMMGSYKSVGADIISSIGAVDFIAEGIDGVIEGIKDRVVYRLSGGGFGTGEGGSRAGDFPFSGIAAGEGEEDEAGREEEDTIEVGKAVTEAQKREEVRQEFTPKTLQDIGYNLYEDFIDPKNIHNKYYMNIPAAGISVIGEIFEYAGENAVYAVSKLPGGQYALEKVGEIVGPVLGLSRSAVEAGARYVLSEGQLQKLSGMNRELPHGMQVFTEGFQDGTIALGAAGKGIAAATKATVKAVGKVGNAILKAEGMLPSLSAKLETPILEKIVSKNDLHTAPTGVPSRAGELIVSGKLQNLPAKADISISNKPTKVEVGELAGMDIIHKNSHEYIGETHVYRIIDSSGKTYKIGESAQGVRKKDGASVRAEQQARKLHEQTGEKYETQIRRTFSSKKEAYEYENRLIERFRKIYGKDALPGNKSNH